MIRRLNIKLEPDKRRVICLPLTLSSPGEMEQRTKRIYENIIKLEKNRFKKPMMTLCMSSLTGINPSTQF